jgi:predicted DNA-binding antitoxin AbrB/MazE fold protein
MAETVTVVYEKGVLRPLQPLKLREQQAVRIQIVQEEPSRNQAEAAIQALVEAGLLTPPPYHTDVAPLTEEERKKVADRLGRVPGKPLSESIIEDRGEW